MNNEEKILELLEQQGKLLEQHGKLLADLRSDMSDMQTTLTKVAVTQENIVLPRLQALYEGQQNLLDTLAPKNRVEALEEEVDLLKTAIRSLSRDVAELKKAQ